MSPISRAVFYLVYIRFSNIRPLLESGYFFIVNGKRDEQKMDIKIKKYQKGRSMIEMLGVLAIIGVLSVGGLLGYSKAMDKYRVNETINQIIYMESNIHNLFYSQSDYSDLGFRNTLRDNSFIVQLDNKAHFIPNSIVKNSYKNLYDGIIQLGYPLNAKKSFFVHYGSIPQEACIALVTYNWSNVEGFITMSVSGTSSLGGTCTYNFECANRDNAIAYTQGVGLFAAAYMPLTPEQAITVCDAEKDNRIAFKFR